MPVEKILIIYYSRTGKSATVCETLQQKISADVLEIFDRKDRSGIWGYLVAAADSLRKQSTEIEPANHDLSTYTLIIVVSPIWCGKLSIPINTFLQKNSLTGKRLTVFTTANVDFYKHENAGEDLSLYQGFVRNTHIKNIGKLKSFFATTGADLIGHYHISTRGVTSKDIVKNTLRLAAVLQESIFLQG